jgi:hypothetical protein
MVMRTAGRRPTKRVAAFSRRFPKRRFGGWMSEQQLDRREPDPDDDVDHHDDLAGRARCSHAALRTRTA